MTLYLLCLFYYYTVYREEKNKSDFQNGANISTTAKLSISIAFLCSERKTKMMREK